MAQTYRWIGRRGVSFSRAMVTTPLCCPSRASILTGDYAHNTGVRKNWRDAWTAVDQRATVQAVLHRAGYLTGIAGKYFNDWPIARRPHFFDPWAVFVPGANGEGYYNTTWDVNGTIVGPPTYSTDFVAERGSAFLRAAERQDHRPWFLYLAPFAPHGPATPGPGCTTSPVPAFRANPAMLERDRSDKPRWVLAQRHGYREALAFRTAQFRALCSVDHLVGRVMSTLVRLREARNTLVVFMSDNGVIWGEHGLADKGYPYLSDLRVPLIVQSPGHIRPGTTDTRLAANIDVAPTILDAAGLTPARGHPMDGRSRLEPWTRRALLAEWWVTSRKNFPAPTWESLITPRFQFVEYRERGRVIAREYYNLVRDPWELTNLLHDGVRGNGPNVRRLHRRLQALRRCAGSSCT